MSLKRASSFNKTSCAKKLRFDDDDLSIKCNESSPKIPPNYFHLGDKNFVFVSYFANQVKTHLRKYIQHEDGRLQPTRMGITLSPTIWEYLTKEMDSMTLDSTSTSHPVLLRDSVLLAPVMTAENAFSISLQRYFLKKDFSRCFLPDICLLSENEWENLRKIRSEVTNCVTTLLLDRLMRYAILKEAKMQSPGSTEASLSDVDMILTTSLLELLKSYFDEEMKKVFVCYGCSQNYANQLGHESMTTNYADRLTQYEHLALFSFDFEKLALDYVKQNANLVNYITKNFFSKLNLNMLLQNVKEMYIDSDPSPVRIC